MRGDNVGIRPSHREAHTLRTRDLEDIASCRGLDNHLVCCDQTWHGEEPQSSQLHQLGLGSVEGRRDFPQDIDRILLEPHNASMRLGLQRGAHTALAANTHFGHILAEASYHHRAQAVV